MTLLAHLLDEFDKQASNPAGIDPFGEVARILSALPDRPEFLSVLLSTARRCFFANHGLILSHHRATKRWFVEASFGLDEAAIKEIAGPTWTVIRQTAESMESVLVVDAPNHVLTRDSRSVRAHNIQAVLCAPILDLKGRVWGVIYLDNSGAPDAFDQESRERLNRFAEFCGIAIQRCDDLVRLTVESASHLDQSKAAEKAFYDFRSPAMMKIMEILRRAAPEETPILLVGETGVGKDYIALWIHEHSPRREAPYAEVNCANIHHSLFEAELFGVEKGAAPETRFREGRIRAADGGTVFLNEIGELPLSIQAKILRVIDNKLLDRVGGDTPVATDVRFVCATNRNLKEMVEKGEFRRDLYYRINVFELTIPPLRERMEDFPHFADHILRQKCREYGRPPMRIPKTVMAQLASMPWIGNLRELANVIGKGVILGEGDEFTLVDNMHDPIAHVPKIRFDKKDSLPDLMDRFEAHIIREALADNGWMVIHAAARLGIPESTLRFKMKKLKIVQPATSGTRRSR
jgi:transcriptional regulator with GAF, ATPase, and Fis domain